MYAGGSGEFKITQVKLIVDPLSIYKSGAPIISVDGSAKLKRETYYSTATCICMNVAECNWFWKPFKVMKLICFAVGFVFYACSAAGKFINIFFIYKFKKSHTMRVW